MFKEEKVATLRVLAVLIAISALIASAAGIIVPTLYRPIVLDETLPFTYGQDITSLAAAIALLLTISSRGMKSNIFQAGIVAYLFYAYAPYVMGTLYTNLYFLYMAVFSLSIFYFINAFTGIAYEELELIMSRPLRIAIAISCLVIVIYFAPQWVAAIWHNISTNTGRETADSTSCITYTSSICVFVLPACAVTFVLLLQKTNLGFVLGGVIQILGFVLMSSVTAGFLCQPLFQQKTSFGDLVQFSIITLVFLILSALYFLRTQTERRRI